MIDMTNKYMTELSAIIKKYLPHTKIFVYGSRARGDFKEGSDIDIALDTGATIDLSIFSNITYDIDESNVPILVDLIDVHAVSEKFLHVIQKDWKEWKD